VDDSSRIATKRSTTFRSCASNFRTEALFFLELPIPRWFWHLLQSGESKMRSSGSMACLVLPCGIGAINDCRWREIGLKIGPLYLGRVGRRLAFATGFKEIGGLTGFNRERNRAGVTGFFRLSQVGLLLTIYRGFRALQPASIAHLDRSSFTRRESSIQMRWYPANGGTRIQTSQEEIAEYAETGRP
jgi:hypothetical protein